MAVVGGFEGDEGRVFGRTQYAALIEVDVNEHHRDRVQGTSYRPDTVTVGGQRWTVLD